MSITWLKFAISKQGQDHRFGQPDKPDGRGQAQHEYQTYRPIQSSAKVVAALSRMTLRESWQDHGAKRHAQQAKRKFHQSVAVIQPAQAAYGQK